MKIRLLILSIAVFIGACSLTAAETPSLSVIDPNPEPQASTDPKPESTPDLTVPQPQPEPQASSEPEPAPVPEAKPGGRNEAISSYDDVKAFMAEMVKKGIDSKTLQNTFDKTRFDYKIIYLMNRPAEKARSWTWYYDAMVSKTRVGNGSLYLTEHKTALNKISTEYKVPANVIAAILGIETNYGKYVIKQTAVQGLATLAFEYPRRASYFRGELEQLFIQAKANGLDPLFYKGSYAGAIGLPQFMPSSMANYAKDGDGDGKVDIVTTHADAIASIANYLRMHGWRDGRHTVALVTPTKTLAANQFVKNICATKGKRTVKQLRELGVPLPEQYKDDEKAFLGKLDEDVDKGTYQVAVFFENACPIYRYNYSLKYVAAVALLAESYE
ncbi:MAG: lytic murein transglycosylase [Deferribacteraceae bacterium]|jgi:membrane-bound lytic murein transglycosylase B|nr:lytic murein transglycosylase [Deferribacteraceae bacterium]